MVSAKLQQVEQGYNSNYCKKKMILSNAIIGCIYILFVIVISIILPDKNFKTNIYYFGMILASVLFSALAQNTRCKYKYKIFIFLSFIILFFNLGFRNFSGIDDESYRRIFLEVSQRGWLLQNKITGMEPGYLILNDLVSFFTNEYIYMQLISSFIPLFLFYHAFDTYKDIIDLPMAILLLSTMFYFQVLSAAVVRIFIAMGIVINSFKYIIKKDYKRYIFMIIIAGMFHYSSLIMSVLLYFSLNEINIFKKKKKFIITSIILTPIIFIVVSKYIAPIMGDRYASYTSIGSFKFDISSFDTLPILFLLLTNKNNIDRRRLIDFNVLIVIFSMSSIISFYSSMVPVGRLIFYTNSSLFLAAPMVSRSLKGNVKGLLFDSIMILYAFIYVCYTQLTLSSHIQNLYPYSNIFYSI